LRQLLRGEDDSNVIGRRVSRIGRGKNIQFWS
jgi:hypothetical protein